MPLTTRAAPLYINGRFLAQPLSGVQRFAVEITSALARRAAAAGHAPPVVLTPRLAAGGGPMVPGGGAPTAWPPGRLELRAVGRRRGQAWEQFELAGHARDGVLLNLGNTAPLRGRRQIVVIHDAGIFRSPETYAWQFRAWYRLMQGWLARGRTKIVTVSEFSRAEIVRYLGAAPADISVIVEGADHMPRVAADPRVLARNGLRPGGFVMAVGNLAAHKNLPALRETAHALAARGLDLVITGGLDGHVFARQRDAMAMPAKYPGRVGDAELRALYEAAACFVFPSLYEGFGLPAVEAMICGCPVVAADIPALREVCGAAARYCDPTAPRDIAAQILALLDDADSRAHLRAAMAARVGRYTWDNAARELSGVAARL